LSTLDSFTGHTDEEKKRIMAESSKPYSKTCMYHVQSIEHPTGKTLPEKEMVRYAKEQLKINHKVHGLDKDIDLSDLTDPTNAWVYLLNVGVGRTSKCEKKDKIEKFRRER